MTTIVDLDTGQVLGCVCVDGRDRNLGFDSVQANPSASHGNASSAQSAEASAQRQLPGPAGSGPTIPAVDAA